MTKEKTFRILMAETHSQYYEVLAINEDEALKRAYNYDENESWALDAWDDGVNDQVHAHTEEV